MPAPPVGLAGSLPLTVAECVALHDRGQLEYDGDLCTLPPLVVRTASWLASLGLLPFVYWGLAVMVPVAVWLAASEACTWQRETDDRLQGLRKARRVAAPASLLQRSYSDTWTPLLAALLAALAVCVDGLRTEQQQTTVWLGACCLWFAVASLRQSWALSCVCCGLTVYQSIYNLPLAVGVNAAQASFGRSPTWTLLVVWAVALALHAASIQLTPQTDLHTYLDAVYVSEFEVRNLTPNQGLHWYFFAQVFDHYRRFFEIVFFAMAMTVGVMPVFIVRDQPFLMVVSCVSFQLMFTPRATIAEVLVTLASLAMFPAIWALHRYRLLCAVVFAICGVLGPVLWHAWIYVGSANPNFFYAISLMFNLGWGACVGELMRAGVLRRNVLTGAAADISSLVTSRKDNET